MTNKTRTCAVCGKKYEFCNKCNVDKDKPLWYFTFCSESCKDIYDTTSKFEDGKITAKQADDKLKKLNLSRIEFFGESYKKAISKIDAEMKKNKIVEKNTTIENENDKKIFKKPVKDIGNKDVE